MPFSLLIIMADAWLQDMYYEHGVILRVVSALKRLPARIENENALPQAVLGDFLEVITNFADRCHHGKEEQTLFPLLGKKRPENRKMINTLLKEHAVGRDFVELMKSESKSKVIAGAVGYADMIPKHIRKETAFFLEAAPTLSKTEKDRLSEEFKRIEKKVIGEGKHEEYLQLVKKVEESTN